MTSINFNAAATSALRTLQSTNTSLDATQNRISTGLKIGEAKDNAAYWSISTTLKSDNASMTTVKDALSLGSATVDTAYQGLNGALDVLNEIKSKLTAATQDGVDRSAVQEEIKALQAQLKSIANSSVFSGENWLSVDSSLDNFSSSKSVVSSFVRNADGSVALGSIDISTDGIALFDGNTTTASRGILDTAGKLRADGADVAFGGNALGNLNVGGLKDTNATTGKAYVQMGAFTAAELPESGDFSDVDTTFTFKIALNGEAAKAITIDGSLVKEALGGGRTSILNATDLKDVVTKALTKAGVTGVALSLEGTDKDELRLTSTNTTAKSEVVISDAKGMGADGTTAFTAADTFEDKANADNTFPAAVATMGSFTGSMTFDSDDTLKFKISVDGGASPSIITINQELVKTALDGKTTISGSDELALVITAAFADADYITELDGTTAGAVITDVTATSVGGKVVFTSAASTATSAVKVYDVTADAGKGELGETENSISVVDIDISATALASRGVTDDNIKTALKAYINVVNDAITKVTAAAANLGAVAKRIDLQSTFVQNLMDTIDKGISGLVDADMNEESTKLQALQVKQQLGVQALSIANQSAQNVLSLFRS